MTKKPIIFNLQIEIEELTLDRVLSTLDLIKREILNGNTEGRNQFSEKADDETRELLNSDYDFGSYRYILKK